MSSSSRPLIGVTTDVDDLKFVSGRRYADAIVRAGGLPILLVPPADPALAETIARAHAALVDGVVFTGGPDVRMEPFGEATHPQAKVMHEARQAYDLALYRAMDDRANQHKPVLGICLGMQEMALHRGGRLTQHMPDVMGEAGAKAHAADALHEVRAVGASSALGGVALGTPGKTAGASWAGDSSGGAKVASWHHQAVSDAGALKVIATSVDGVIEAVEDPSRPFYLGVQWHPERSPNTPGADDLADGLFRKLVERARAR